MSEMEKVLLPVCPVCGQELSEDDRCCPQCGTARCWQLKPVETSPAVKPESAPVSVSEQTAVKVPEALPQHSRAVRAGIFLLCAWALQIGIHMIPGNGLFYLSTVSAMFAMAMLGLGVYFLMPGEPKWNFRAVGSIVLYLLMSAVNDQVNALNSQKYGEFRVQELMGRLFGHASVGTSLKNYLWDAAVVVIGVLFFKWLFRQRPEKRRLWLTSRNTALLLLASDLVQYLLSGRGTGAALGRSLILGIFSTLVLAAVPVGLSALCRERKTPLHLSAWGKIWCILCAVGMGLTAFVLMVSGMAETYSAQLVMLIFTCIGFVTLLRKNRIGWYWISFSAFLILTGEMRTALPTAIFNSSSSQSELMGCILSGGANVGITWLSIKKSWRMGQNSECSYPPEPRRQNRSNHPKFARFSAIYNLLVGLAAILLPIISLAMGNAFQPTMLVFLLPGVMYSISGLRFLNRQKRAQGHASGKFNAVLFAITMVLALAGIISSL